MPSHLGVGLPQYTVPGSGPVGLHRTNRTVAAHAQVNLDLEVWAKLLAYNCMHSGVQYKLQ